MTTYFSTLARGALSLLAWVAYSASAQDCERATRNYNVSNGAMGRNQEMVDRAYSEMLQACGGGQRSQTQQQQYQPPARRGPGQFVNCDQAGCWGSANNVRYTFVAGGNLAGADGSFCARGAGNTFSCN